MNIQEKKRAIIEKINQSNSDDFISRIYYDIIRDKTWDETEEGKDLILKLLDKSSKEIREGKKESFFDVLNESKEKYGLK
ncbi:MAG: hypothetical protein Q8K02_03765 [Flavobacterium sp.]|nr:hypothetical protein [Flavobacterium sp.]